MVETKNNNANSAEVVTLQPIVANQVHVSSRGGLTFFKDKIVTAADDTIMKVFAVTPETATIAEHGEPLDLEGETFAVSSNQVDTIAIGGQDNKAYLQKVEVEEDGTFKLLDSNKDIAMCFDSPVTKLEFYTGGKLLGVSEDCHVQILDTETNKVTNYSKSAHEGSVRNAAIDPNFEFLATTGCDGSLKVTKMADQKVVKTCKITKKNTTPTSNQLLELAWSPSGDQLFYAGDTQLGMVQRQDGFASQHVLAEINHSKDISLVRALSNQCLVTVGLDKWVKVWHLPQTDLSVKEDSAQVKLIAKFKTEHELMQLKYSSEQNLLAFLDVECTVGVVQVTSALLEGRVATLSSMEDEIDIDAIDAAMEEEEAAAAAKRDESAPIDLDEMKDAMSEDGAAAKEAPKTEATPVEETKTVVESEAIENAEDEIKPRKRVQFSGQEQKSVQQQQYAQDDWNTAGNETQLGFLSNCKPDFVAGKHKILSWNTVGVVGIRAEFQYTVIDIEFMDRTFHRNLSINDDFNVVMAAMNYNGVLLASMAEASNEDSYEEDPADDKMDGDDMERRRKSSNLQFKPFNEWKDVKEWNYELKNGESAESLAVGSGWNAVLTNYNYIRVFSNNGIQKDLLCQAHPVVTMAGYENFLVVVYQSGPAFCGYQPMRLKVINMATRDNRVLFDADCPVTPTSELKWFGFSEEGQLFSFDTLGIVRSFSYMTQTWSPRHDFKVKHGHLYRQLWVAGISGQELLVIEMPKDHDAPSLAQKSNVRRFVMKLPLLDMLDDQPEQGKEPTLPQIEAKLQTTWLHLEHEIFRKQNWESLKHFRSKYDNEFAQSESILDQNAIIDLKKAMDKDCLNAIRLCIMGDQKEKVFDYMDQLHFSQSLKLCAKMCDKLKAQDLAQKVSKFIQDKETREVFLKQLPQDKQPLAMSVGSLQERKMTQATAQPISFSEQFKNDKSSLLGSSQISTTTLQTNTQDAAKKGLAQARQNPFQKKTVAPKPTGAAAAGGDIFSDLKGSAKLNDMSQNLLQKRPYNGGVAQPSKQRKLFN